MRTSARPHRRWVSRNAMAGGEAAAAKAKPADKVQPAVIAYAASQQTYVVLQQAHGAAVRAATGAERMRTRTL